MSKELVEMIDELNSSLKSMDEDFSDDFNKNNNNNNNMEIYDDSTTSIPIHHNSSFYYGEDEKHPNTLSYDSHKFNKIIFEDSEYLYRTITRDDLPALKKLQQELFPVQYNKPFYLKLLDKSKTYTLLSFSKENNELIGVCSTSITLEENTDGGFWQFLFGYPDKYNVCYIMTLGVKKKHRRKGLASRMLQILEEVVSVDPYYCTKLTLHCKVDNQHALSFYNQNSFTVKERIEGYYDFGSHFEAAFKLDKVLSAKRNESFSDSISFSGLLTSESHTSLGSQPTSNRQSTNESPIRNNYNTSSLGCLAVTFQICKFFIETFKVVAIESYNTMNNILSPSPPLNPNSSSPQLSNSTSTNALSPIAIPRPRIVLQIQEKDCE
ncbi:N-acetyltransferase [Naegleria gruberi]|uniref:N-alpha-acetyltransferase 60 n=1 Tax=Naegleria gruberi TaxID=5762 RepID=D2VQX7_NAEGR|nr:N-acetyltransferase [Naegleria gruberi]EFC40714.1 N-acetyltransferase [Naegleria gruberi]|eukprot:XP_002673458.1 N-acetyltransferase [Naegleria gruberi strain NEG-M]